MSKAYEIRFRATRSEYERIFMQAQINGSKTLASFFRSRVFGLGFSIEQKIIENNKILKRLELHLLDRKAKDKYMTATSEKNIQESPKNP